MDNVVSPHEILILKETGKVAADILKKIKGLAREGISTRDIESFFEEQLGKHPVLKAAFKGYKGYPASLCVSVNEEIIHGIPHPAKVLRQGDIVSVDLGIERQGLFVDCAASYPVGRSSQAVHKLIKVCRGALHEGIKKARIGLHVGDIGCTIQQYVEKRGFSVIRKFVGHGTGRALHLAPEIPNFGACGEGDRIEEGMVLAIEPMIASGSYEVEVLGDGWTVKTKDGSLSSHCEHTVVVTKRGPLIVTQ